MEKKNRVEDIKSKGKQGEEMEEARKMEEKREKK